MRFNNGDIMGSPSKRNEDLPLLPIDTGVEVVEEQITHYNGQRGWNDPQEQTRSEGSHCSIHPYEMAHWDDFSIGHSYPHWCFQWQEP